MYKQDIGKRIWARNRTSYGTVRTISNRYCAACQGDHTCYIVDWEDGEVTKPCTAGVKVAGDELEIM